MLNSYFTRKYKEEDKRTRKNIYYILYFFTIELDKNEKEIDKKKKFGQRI